MRLLAAALTLVWSLIFPALAQDGPLGIAYVQAPEMGGGVCFGVDARQTIDCAQQICVRDTGLEAADCIIEGWCSPMRWTADIFVQHSEGPHWHAIQCGWSSEAKMYEAVALFCTEDYFLECSVTRVWNPQGEPQEVRTKT
jgi:hypothetical protein